MRDILTILAGIVIAALLAALAIPPLVDWTAYRGAIEGGLSRALGLPVRTEGPLDLRLLPTPRLRVHRLRGGAEGSATTLDAMFVRAEIALTPLLSGEVRILDARIGRAEIKLPVGTSGDWRLPAGLPSGAARHRGWALEEMRVEQFLLTATEPATGRTDQFDAAHVRIEAGSGIGPWRFSGERRGQEFDLAIGQIAEDGTAALKLGAGGGAAPRLELDGQIALAPATEGWLRPRLGGVLKWNAGGRDFPIRAQANLAAEGGIAELAELVIEAGDGPAAIRLTGAGRLLGREPKLELTLAGRRVDAVAVASALGGQAVPVRERLREGVPIPVDLSLKLEGLAAGLDEDLAGLSLRASIDRTQGRLEALDVSGPGRSTFQAAGTFALGGLTRWMGRVTLAAADGQRLGRSLEGLGLPGLSGLLQPRPLDASAEISLVDPIVSLRNLRLAQGDIRASGSVRLSPAEPGVRARLDAQLAIEGLDISTLPQAGPVFALARGRDLGLSIDARDIRHAGRRGGRIAGRIATQGASIVVDGLEVRDLAGARAQLSGRIAPDGGGRIEGRLSAPQAAPLIDLFGRAAFGGLSRLLPGAVRDGSLDLKVGVERTGGADPAGSVVETTLEGRLGGAPFEGMTRTSGGALHSFEARADADAVFGLPPGAGPAPRLLLKGIRSPAGLIEGEVAGEIAGLRLRTLAPIRFGGADDRLDAGEVSLEGPDARTALARLGWDATGLAGSAVPVSLSLALGRRDTPHLVASGDVAGTRVVMDLAGESLEELKGTVSLDALSLPRLASWIVLGRATPPSPGAIWPAARFAKAPPAPFAGTFAVRVARLDLGMGPVGQNAAFTLALTPGGMRLSQLDLRLGEARLRGDLGLERQNGLASLTGEAVIEGIEAASLLAAPFSGGRLTAKLRFGASGESVAGIVANLGGAGEIAAEGLRIEGADPAGPARLAARILKSGDPLASQRWQPALGEELAHGPLASAAPANAPGVIVGGALRLSPLRIDGEAGNWQGTATLDLRNLGLDMRGVLQSKEPPPGWTGAPPSLGLAWSGPLGRSVQAVDAAPLVNGLATNVLARELDRIDTFERDAAEQQRRTGRDEMERQRKAEEIRRRLPLPEAPPAPPPSPVPARPAPAGPGG